MKNDDAILIGQVAKQLSIHEQTIRMYEKLGLIKPVRLHKRRRYNQVDINRITIIIILTQELGLSLKGVELFFNLAANYDIDDDELLDFIIDFNSGHIEE